MHVPPALTRSAGAAITLDRAGLGAVLVFSLIVAALDARDGARAVAATAAAAAGIAAIHERTRREFSPAIALLTSLLFFAATPVSWFAFGVVSPQITSAFACVAVATLLAARLPRRTAGARAIALIAGPVAAVVATAFIAGGSPAWRHWTDALFSSAQGLLSWTPVAYIAAAGLLLYARQQPRQALAIAAAVIVASVVVVWRGAGDEPMGALLPAMALLPPGLASVARLAHSRPAVAIVPLVALALLWNSWLMIQYTIGLLPKDEPVSFAAMVRQQAVVHTTPPYLYPFAFPLNLWFALRHGAPADRYDLLALEPMSSSFDLVLDRRSARFLLDGWDAPGADADDPSWWIRNRRATLLIPLTLDRPEDLRVLIRARTRYEEPAVEAQLGVEINGREVGRFAPSPLAPSEATFVLPAEVVGRAVRAGYNRLTFVSHGVRRIDPADSRSPGPIAAGLGSRAWPVAIYRVRIHPAP